jgi:hypothetical protein
MMAGMPPSRLRGPRVRLAAGVVALGLLVPAISGQARWRNEALAPAEVLSTRAFGEEFVRQLAARRDATPLVPDWFVHDFPDRLVDILSSADLSFDHRGMLLFWLSPDLLRTAEREQVLEYYLAHLNFWYLANLHNLSRRTPAQLQAVETFDGALPVSVSGQLYQNDLFMALLTLPLGVVMADDAAGRKVTVDTVEDMRRGVDSLTMATARLRADVTRPPAEGTATYRETQKMFDQAMSFAPPGTVYRRAAVCLSPCVGMPAGTRFREVAVLPSLHLHIMNVDRQMRVFFVDLPVS